jgi:hypothetical protein
VRAVRDSRTGANYSREVNRFRWFCLSRTGFKGRLPVNLYTVNALRGQCNCNGHDLLYFGANRPSATAALSQPQNASVASGGFFAPTSSTF